MEAHELPAMMAALVLAFGVIVAKVMTTQLIGRMNRQINQVAQIKAEALGRLKGAQGQKSVVEKNRVMLFKKKTKVAKKIDRLKKEMSGMKEEESARRKRSESRRVS
jgi:MinD-like ATPase involved in chromosome partitioning or flagellar assembly